MSHAITSEPSECISTQTYWFGIVDPTICIIVGQKLLVIKDGLRKLLRSFT